jgi:hypothetical protein
MFYSQQEGLSQKIAYFYLKYTYFNGNCNGYNIDMLNMK